MVADLSNLKFVLTDCYYNLLPATGYFLKSVQTYFQQYFLLESISQRMQSESGHGSAQFAREKSPR